MSSILRVGRHNIIPPIMQIRVMSPRTAAAAAWWVVPGKTCVAAYQAKGAASYAASLVNLANPGTNDAVEGATPPAGWNVTDGWINAPGGSTLNCPAGANYNYTMLIRMIGARNIGRNEWNRFFLIQPVFSDGRARYLHGTSSALGASTASSVGVIGLAGNVGYFNGVADTAPIGTSTFTGATPLVMSTAPNSKTQAFVLYSDSLTPGEMATLSAAMAAL